MQRHNMLSIGWEGGGEKGAVTPPLFKKGVYLAPPLVFVQNFILYYLLVKSTCSVGVTECLRMHL